MQRTIDSLAARLKVAHQSLDSLQLRAPISGQLTSFNAHLGEAKMLGQRIGQVDQIDRSKITAVADEFYLSRVVVGQPATATMAGVAYALKVSKIYPEVRERTFKIDFAFQDEAPPGAHRGQEIQLRLDIGGTSHALIVTNGAFYDEAARGVFVVNSSGNSAERRVVTLGRRNTEQVEVLAGLAAGEHIVTSSYESFSGISHLQFM
jgi:HlyD family secretion protein